MAEPGYTPPEQALTRQIQALNERLNRLERPTGSQNNRNKDKVQAALDDLQAEVDFQASLITKTAESGSFNSGTIPPDQIVHWLTTPESLALSITLDVPTGRALVTYGCAEMSVKSDTDSAQARMGFDLVDDTPRFSTNVYVGQNYSWFGAGASRSHTIDVPAGTNTFRSRFAGWSAGGAASAQFNGPWMSVQVLPPA